MRPQTGLSTWSSVSRFRSARVVPFVMAFFCAVSGANDCRFSRHPVSHGQTAYWRMTAEFRRRSYVSAMKHGFDRARHLQYLN